MHFVSTRHPRHPQQQQATQQKKPQSQKKSKSTQATTTSTLTLLSPRTRISSSSSAASSTSSSSSSISSSTSSSKSSLSRTLGAAQNYFINFRQREQHSKSSKLKPMIKNIENTSTTTNPDSSVSDVQENEEKEKDCCDIQRRDSVHEDPSATTSSSNSKLLTIPESSNESNSNSNGNVNNVQQTTTTTAATTTLSSTPSISQPLSSGICLKTQRFEVAAATTNTTSSSTTAATIATTASDTQSQQTSNKVFDDIILPSGGGSDADVNKPLSTPSPGNKGIIFKITPSASSSKISLNSQLSNSSNRDEDTQTKAVVGVDTSSEPFVRSTSVVDSVATGDKPGKCVSRLSERAKKKSWYNVIYPNYKSRAEDFKKLFKDVPNDERLIVDYSCALQRDILVQGRLYVSQNYVCFHANIFSWETYVSIKWKEVTAITKEKTALVIPNAISISTESEKYFFATFTARDKSFLMLFRVWQNTLMNKTFSPQEIWKYVHNWYGEELGLTTDDEDYIDPTIDPNAAVDTDVEFTTAVDDTASIVASVTSDFTTVNTNSNQSINLTQQQQQQQQASGGNSSASSGGGSGVRKSKSKSYFFNSGKSSNLNSSANASASGSDTKASDNSRKSNKKMKSNAKELTLSSVKPEDQSVSVSFNAGTGPSTANTAANSSTNITETKSSTTALAPMAVPVSTSNLTTNHDAKRKVSKSSRQREEAVAKNAEHVPTDVSDSSDSEETNIPFVATTECTSTHEGRQILHTILPINVETMFSLLFSKSKFLTDFHALRKSTDLLFGEWTTNEEGLKTRQFNVTVQLAASVGPKTSKVTEFQTMRDCSKPGELYSIDINSVNAGIPYADSFSVLMHYCLVRTVDDHTMLSIHAQIKYKKSIWGVVKGFIEKNTWAGLEDFYTSLLHALQSETCIPPAKGKGRRPRRGTATQIRPMEDGHCMGTAQIKNETLESSLSATHSTVHTPQANTFGSQLTPKQQQQRQYQQRQNEHCEGGTSKFKGFSIFVIFLMCCLLVLNVILLLKLWKLEERFNIDLNRRSRMPPTIAALKEMPNTNQDWLELLREQEVMHESELRKWHEVLRTAIELLKKTEKTLAELLFR